MEAKEEMGLLQEEEVEEEDESSLMVRKSRNGVKEKKPTSETGFGFEFEVGNGHTDTVVAANGTNAQNQEQDLNPIVQDHQPINGSEDNQVPIPEKNQKMVEVDSNEGTIEEHMPINGEQESHSLVFYDKDEGIWKCRVCSWTHHNGNVCVHNFQNHNGQIMTVNTLNFQFQGIGSAPNGHVEEEQIEKGPEDIIKSNVSTKEIESVDADLINEDVLEVTEDLDVEGVLKKQTTHDLYCPNCNSCITKRVILRKRKRRNRPDDDEVKRIKNEEEGTAQTPSQQVQSGDRVDASERNQGPDVFRCLSCFSFFIPIGNGLFRLFGVKNGKENTVKEQGSSVQESGSQNTGVAEGSSSKTTIPEAHHVSDRIAAMPGDDDIKSKDKILTFPSQKPWSNGKLKIGDRDQLAMATMETIDQSKESKVNKEVHLSHENDLSATAFPSTNQLTDGESVEDSASFQEGGLKLLIPASNGSPVFENAKDSRMPNQTIETEDNEAIHLSPALVSVLEASDVVGKLNIRGPVPNKVQDATPVEPVLESKNVDFRNDEKTVAEAKVEANSGKLLKVNSIPYSPAGQLHSGKPLKVDSIPHKDTVITIDTAQSAGSTEVVPDPTETTPLLEAADRLTKRTEERREYEVEVIKSIVYGGLAESITSLSIVSSAAGGGAATLNVFALGMANLIGGLFIIFHNLWELRGESTTQVSNQISDGMAEHKDRYKELLGRRQNFVLHATVAIISYLVFGLVPPVVYGFSFRKTDDRQFKLVVLAATSLVCIAVLAIGRAYVQAPPKPYLKSLMTFVILGFMVSGASYAAGELFERLLVKLGIFQPSPASNRLTY